MTTTTYQYSQKLVFFFSLFLAHRTLTLPYNQFHPLLHDVEALQPWRLQCTMSQRSLPWLVGIENKVSITLGKVHSPASWITSFLLLCWNTNALSLILDRGAFLQGCRNSSWSWGFLPFTKKRKLRHVWVSAVAFRKHDLSIFRPSSNLTTQLHIVTYCYILLLHIVMCTPQLPGVIGAIYLSYADSNTNNDNKQWNTNKLNTGQMFIWWNDFKFRCDWFCSKNNPSLWLLLISDFTKRNSGASEHSCALL